MENINFSLIANTGIQMLTFPLEINMANKYKMWFREWIDSDNSKCCLESVYQLKDEDLCAYFKKIELYNASYFNGPESDINFQELKLDGINPLQIEDDLCEGVEGEIFDMSFNSRHCMLSKYEDVWLPIPYFLKRTERLFNFGPHNWARMKLVPKKESKGIKHYDVLLAFDTRCVYESNGYDECPTFHDKFKKELDFALCDNEYLTMDYCSPTNNNGTHIDQYLQKIVHPDVEDITKMKGCNGHKMSYKATYMLLMQYIAESNMLPHVTLYKDTDVEVKNIDMVIDIGNSMTTALLVEDSINFNQTRMLQLIDYTNPIKQIYEDKSKLRIYTEPFDMRLAFRKVNFGSVGIKDSKQFVYPSFVRLGKEANSLIHQASDICGGDKLSTYSSPKRYLWDWRPNKEEWKMMILEGEESDEILNIKGITEQLNSDGTINRNGTGGKSFYYSRRSLMTFAFLEMLTQAHTQCNSIDYRSSTTGHGQATIPRRIKKIILTCPTAMSKEERIALNQCANDAIVLFENFHSSTFDNVKHNKIEIAPNLRSLKEDDVWYYDEATCAQLVYIYGEVGHKYKGSCSEFFKLYGKIESGDTQHSITVGSIDIGAGTSDLMISKYSYENDDITTITPDPRFFDSYYYAGDNMLGALIKNIMLFGGPVSAFRTELKHLSNGEYRQKIKNFFGPDYNGQTMSDRVLRRDFNIQYSIPVMYYMLDLLNKDAENTLLGYEDIFKNNEPKQYIIDKFKEVMGIDITQLNWYFDKKEISKVIKQEFEPLLKKVATIMYASACDIVLLSGRPASLLPIRQIFLKYYPVSPNRLITLNNYYVGDWYPFGNNTGYITNPKSIVAIGGLLGHYATEMSSLNKFVINVEKLKNNLTSTVNYIEGSKESLSTEYFITPESHTGKIKVSSFPEYLRVRQLGMDSYPSRVLYSVDFNRHKISERIRRRSILDGGEIYSDSKVMSLVNENIDNLRKKMPFTIELTRDPLDKEKLSIQSIVDREGNEVMDSNLEVHTQSLGADEKFWLDSGVFYF